MPGGTGASASPLPPLLPPDCPPSTQPSRREAPSPKAARRGKRKDLILLSFLSFLSALLARPGGWVHPRGRGLKTTLSLLHLEG